MLSGRPIALKGHSHICPDCAPRPHLGGPIIDTQGLVTVEGVPIAVVGNKCLCTGVPVLAAITDGSSVVSIEGSHMARISDLTEHGGKIAEGVDWITAE
jgi:uncharacterized Zn-binding protein involved in type VI secretion